MITNKVNKVLSFIIFYQFAESNALCPHSIQIFNIFILDFVMNRPFLEREKFFLSTVEVATMLLSGPLLNVGWKGVPTPPGALQRGYCAFFFFFHPT